MEALTLRSYGLERERIGATMDKPEWARLRGLREREDSLTDGERQELDVLLRRADEEEARLLIPALERMATEAGRLEAAAADVREICEREERLARRLERSQG